MTDSTIQETNGGSPNTSPSNISILSNLLSSPQKAFEDMQVNYPVLFPLMSILTLNILVVIFLYANMDFEWFVEHMVELQGENVSNAEQDQMRQGMEMMSSTTLGIIGAVSVGLVLSIVFCIMSLYLVMVSNITNDGFQFKQWFSFVCWTAIPSLIGTLASMVVIFSSSNGQISPETLNPLSFNALFFGLNAISGLGNILASSDLTMFWTIALMTIGYSKWTDKNLQKSFVIVVAPYVLYFSVRILML